MWSPTVLDFEFKDVKKNIERGSYIIDLNSPQMPKMSNANSSVTKAYNGVLLSV